ncbi:MAG: TetR/AcrR family transcriptional regulator [Solobacterium sp.]|nr:TetR/AcrR family transcriptional regulator [Solobacterium sp.]MCH4222751.1 TetR/AcrR family transcriptional regulator [Solobacterium sp.]MCH4266322.1 TetR/AcrR family transcriptional regulator [Solobacterium sp.]
MTRETETGKKREIRMKAIALFRENGYDAVTINDICAASEISKNTFYYYFSGKEDLIMDLFKVMQTVSEDELMQIMAIADPYEQLKFIYGTLTDDVEKLGKEIMKKALMANLSKAETFEKDAKAVQRKDHTHKPNPYYAMMHSIYERAQQAGEIRDDVKADELLKTSMALFMGCLQIWATAPCKINLTAMYREHYDLLILKQK